MSRQFKIALTAATFVALVYVITAMWVVQDYVMTVGDRVMAAFFFFLFTVIGFVAGLAIGVDADD